MGLLSAIGRDSDHKQRSIYRYSSAGYLGATTIDANSKFHSYSRNRILIISLFIAVLAALVTFIIYKGGQTPVSAATGSRSSELNLTQEPSTSSDNNQGATSLNSAAKPSPSSTSTGSSSSSLQFNSTTSNGTSKTQLNVNGQSINVPANGSTSKVITSQDGSQTTVTTSSQQSTNGSAQNSNFSSSNINIDSMSSTNSQNYNEEGQ